MSSEVPLVVVIINQLSSNCILKMERLAVPVENLIELFFTKEMDVWACDFNPFIILCIGYYPEKCYYEYHKVQDKNWCVTIYEVSYSYLSKLFTMNIIKYKIKQESHGSWRMAQLFKLLQLFPHRSETENDLSPSKAHRGSLLYLFMNLRIK